MLDPIADKVLAPMMALAAPSLIASLAVLGLLSPLRHGAAHLRTAWIFARMDVMAKLGVSLASLRVWLDGPWLQIWQSPW